MTVNKPILLYYQVLDFQDMTLEFIRNHFKMVSLPNPDHDNDDILRSANVIYAPMGFVFDRNKIERCKNLQVIATPTTGTVHIDEGYARKKNISICSLKEQREFLANITPTAELAWGLLLAVTRRILQAHESVLQGEWQGRVFGEKTPKMLSSMTLGVVGLGRLGSWVAKYGRAFRMKVYYYDPYVTDDNYIKCENIYDLAKLSDIVSIHVHLTDETENLIDRKFMRSMQKASYIINTARGGIVNEDALLEALKSGHLAGAGLDMLAGEHLPGFKEKLTDHPLIKYANTNDNLVITPKMGGCTVDAWNKTELFLINLVIQDLKNRRVM